MNPFSKAKWIWADYSLEVDDYAEFVTSFNVFKSQELKVLIAADSVYAFYFNGELVKFMDCSAFKTKKFYDEFKKYTGKTPAVYRSDTAYIGVNSL